MSEVDSLRLPESMQPLADPRVLAAELRYGLMCMQCARGELSPEAEAAMRLPEFTDYAFDEAITATGQFLDFMCTNPVYGLIADIDNATVRRLGLEVGAFTRDLGGTSRLAVRQVATELGAARETLRGLMSDDGYAQTAQAIDGLRVICGALCEDETLSGGQQLMDVVMRSRHDPVYYQLRSTVGSLD